VAHPPRRIGLISDTHGLLREEAVEALRGSELILHAGDVGKPEIIDTLRKVAPIVAIRGNVDQDSWASALPDTAVVEADSVLIYVLHNLKELDLDPVAAGFRVVVSGHSHKPARIQRSGILYINPGSAGPKRFSLPTTIARLDLAVNPWKIDFVDILDGRLLSPAEIEQS
jgi:putative phosphoesterase